MAAASGSSRRPPWPDLPQELLGLVLARVPSHTDRVRLRAVCRAWHSSAPQRHALPPLLPWLALPDGTFLSLSDSAIHRLSKPDDICELFNVHGDGTCSLTSPSPVATAPLPEPVPFWFRKNSRASHLLNNINKALVSDHLVAVLKRSGRSNVLTAHEELHLVDVDDEQTAAAPAEKTIRIRSIPSDEDEHNVVDIDVQDAPLEWFDPYRNDIDVQRSYLVVSGDQLLMVKRTIRMPPILSLDDSVIEKRTHRFRVFEAADLLNDGHGRWREVTTLTGRALFVSEGCSVSVPAAAQCGTSRAREDCIYFITEDQNIENS